MDRQDSYNLFLSADSAGDVVVTQEDGSTVPFFYSNGLYQGPPRVLATLVANGDGTLTFTRQNQQKFTFAAPTPGTISPLLSESDRNGYTTSLTYTTPLTNDLVSKITDPSGRALTFSYDGNNHITSIGDPIGRTVVFTYNTAGELTAAQDVRGYVTHFTYTTVNNMHLLQTMTDPNNGAVSNVYDGSGRVLTQTDPMQRTTTFTYTVPDATQVSTTTITDPRGYVTVEQYQDYELRSLTKGYGTPQQATSTYTYDPATRGIASESDPNGHTSSNTWDAHGNLLSHTDPLGRTTSYAYDALNDTTAITDPLGVLTTNTYDANGNLLSASRPLTPTGSGTNSTINSTGSVSFTVSPASGLVNSGISVTADNSKGSQCVDGQLVDVDFDGHLAGEVSCYSRYINGQQLGYFYVTITVPLNAAVGGHTITVSFTQGRTIAGSAPFTVMPSPTFCPQAGPATYTATVCLAYDPVHPGDVITRTNPDGYATQYSYDRSGDLASVSDPMSDTTRYGYDPIGRQTSMVTPNGNAPGATPLSYTTTMTYDAAGDPTVITNTQGFTTSQQYDANRNLIAVTDARNNTTRDGYDLDNERISVTEPNQTVLRTGYDADGNVITRTNGMGYQTQYGHDPLNRTTITTDTRGYTSTVGYDLAGNIITTTDALGHQTVNGYDQANQRTSARQPDGSLLGTGYDLDGDVITTTNGVGDLTRYSYDSLNRLVVKTDPLSRTTAYGYDLAGNKTSVTDAMGRVTTSVYDTANRLTTINYSDGSTPTVIYTYTPDGQRSTMADGTGATAYRYDTLDRPVQVTNGASARVGYGYDAVGNPTTLTYPDSSVITRTYDALNRVSGVQDWLGHATAFSYDGDNNLITTTLPNGTSSVVGYNSNDQVTSSVASAGTTAFWTATYTRNGLGQVAAAAETGTPGDSYSYDRLNHLTQDTQTGPYRVDMVDAAGEITQTQEGGATAPVVQFGYDVASEITAITKTYPGNTPYATSFAYNPDGDRTAQGPSTYGSMYGYDQADRLITVTINMRYVTTASYQYDGDGLRQDKTVNGVTTAQTWDTTAGLPLLLQDGGTRYLMGPDGVPLEQIDGGGHVLSYYHDQLGSTRVLRDGSGAAVATYTYDPYGTLTASTGSVTTPFGYAGQYTDAETGLQYLRARYYDPATAQFIARDQLVNITGQPYAYATDDPVNANDPSGLLSCKTFLCLGDLWQWIATPPDYPLNCGPHTTAGAFGSVQEGGSAGQSPITNANGEPYPNTTDPRTGEPVRFPNGQLQWTPKEDRAPWNRSGDFSKGWYIREWYARGYSTPSGGWAGKEIHHIRPREQGGTNAFDNLIPLAHDDHVPFTNWWRNYTQPSPVVEDAPIELPIDLVP